jgi:hypothetical protein
MVIINYLKGNMQHLTPKIAALLAAAALLLGPAIDGTAQPVPADDENIPFLVTFGKASPTSHGDDDFAQVFFLMVPKTIKTPFYVRVFDPDVSGQHDEIYNDADTKTKFSVYGGPKAYSNPNARESNPVGDYNSGTLLGSKTFGADSKYDNDWYTFGPFNPTDGDSENKFNAYIFKIIAEGVSGNDGNLYRYYFSTYPDKNSRLEGANAFTFEYTFRMPSKAGAICHLYPYIDPEVTSVKQFNFDWDDDGVMKIISYEKKGEWVSMSNENNWVESTHIIMEKERNASLDFQFVKSANTPKENNNVCFYIRNQYGEFMPFYNIPIGGVPKYKYETDMIENLRATERDKSGSIYKK